MNNTIDPNDDSPPERGGDMSWQSSVTSRQEKGVLIANSRRTNDGVANALFIHYHRHKFRGAASTHACLSQSISPSTGQLRSPLTGYFVRASWYHFVPPRGVRKRTGHFVHACTIRTYEFDRKVPIEAHMMRIFPLELATATQPFRRIEHRTEPITRRERRAPRGSSLRIFFRFVQ